MSNGNGLERRKIKMLGLAAALAVAIVAGASTEAHAFQDEGTIILCSIEPLSGIGTSFGAPNYIGKLRYFAMNA